MSKLLATCGLGITDCGHILNNHGQKDGNRRQAPQTAFNRDTLKRRRVMSHEEGHDLGHGSDVADFQSLSRRVLKLTDKPSVVKG